MGTRLIFVPGNHGRLELLCPKAIPVLLAEMLRCEGVSADYVDFSGLPILRDYPAVADDNSGSRSFLGMSQLPFSSKVSGHIASEVLNTRLRQEILEEVLTTPAPSVIAWYVEGREDFSVARELSGYIKELSPNTHQTILGPYIIHYGAASLNNVKSIDTGITGDPVSVLAALSTCVDNPESQVRIPGLLFHTRSGLASSPRDVYPRRNVLSREFMFRDVRRQVPCEQAQLPLFPITFNCNTVSGYGLKPGIVRPLQKSASQMIDEMYFLNRNHGAGAFHIEAAHVSGTTLERFADTLLANNFMSIFSLGELTEAFDVKVADRLFASGCRAVGFNTPTGSQRLLEDFYGCEMSVSAMRATLRHCRAAGLFTVAHLCYPCPWDDYHTRAETDLFLEACRPDGITIHAPELLPESIWFSRAPAYGFVFDHRSFQQWVEGVETHHGHMPYRMQHWKRGRVAEARRSLAAHAESLGCAVGITERHGLLARIARSEMDESLFLERLQQGLSVRDVDELAALMQCISNTLDTLHADSLLVGKAAEAL